MEQESLHESLRVPLGGGWLLAGSLATFAAVLTMAICTYETRSWVFGWLTAVYGVLMALGSRKLWSIYSQLRPNHTQADVKEFNKRAKSFAVLNQFVMLAFQAMLIWLRH